MLSAASRTAARPRAVVAFTLVLASMLAVLIAAPARAADELSSGAVLGRLQTSGGAPAAGGVVELYVAYGSARKGSYAGLAVSDGNGMFRIRTGLPSGTTYFVRVRGSRYRDGWVARAGGYGQSVVPDRRRASVVGRIVGNVTVDPTYVTGRVVDPRTGRGLENVWVSVRPSWAPFAVVARGRTNSNGRFAVLGVEYDSLVMYVNGKRVGRESGWRDCGGVVVQDLRSVDCGVALGDIGALFLERQW